VTPESAADGEDLLQGLDSPRPAAGLRGFVATTIGASLLTWDIAFDYGAFHTVFFFRLQQIAVVATVLLLCSLTLRRRIHTRPWVTPLLAVPLLWLIFRFLTPYRRPGYHTVDTVLALASLASLPVILWIVARLLAPDYFALRDRRLQIAAIAIIAVVTAIGYVVGLYNYRYLTCEDFTVSGNDTPANCAHTSSSR
jgi:hypothetical protein